MARSSRSDKGRARWASKHAPLYVAGEEAGGNLAAALALMARDRHGPPLAGQILLSPMLDACLGTCSLREADAGPVGCRWADGWARLSRLARQGGAPLCGAASNASRLAGLAPALLISAQDDPMRDEAAAIRDAPAGSGCDASAIMCRLRPTQWPGAYAGRRRNGSCLCLARHHVQ